MKGYQSDESSSVWMSALTLRLLIADNQSCSFRGAALFRISLFHTPLPSLTIERVFITERVLGSPSTIRLAPSTGSLSLLDHSLFLLLSLSGQSCVSSSIPLSTQLNFEVLFPSKRRLAWPRPEIPLQEGRGLRACLCLAVLPFY